MFLPRQGTILVLGAVKGIPSAGKNYSLKSLIFPYPTDISVISAFTLMHGRDGVRQSSTRIPTNVPAKIRAVTLGSNFTARISCQVSFCRCKISGLELIFSVIDLDFRAVD